MKKILVVDDESTSLVIIHNMLHELGFCAIKSQAADHALQTLKCNDDIALVITDMQMPKKDGRWLIKQIFADSSLKKTPIIIMSGAVGVKDIADLLQAGAKAFIAKPVEKSELKEYIERYI